jgi:hypothetical protein
LSPIREERKTTLFLSVEQKVPHGLFTTLSVDDFVESYQRARMGAQINDLQNKSLICKETENDTFRFPLSKKSRQDFLRPYGS